MPGSSSDFSLEKIGNWVGDFCHSDALGLFPGEVAESAQAVLETFLHESCRARGNALDALDEPDVKQGLLQGVARLDLPESTRAFVPSLCRAFLEDLQRRGRIGNGLDLGRYTGALKQAYLEAASTKGTPYERPGAKIGRNDPCPCGSGKKFKKCCGGNAA